VGGVETKKRAERLIQVFCCRVFGRGGRFVVGLFFTGAPVGARKLTIWGGGVTGKMNLGGREHGDPKEKITKNCSNNPVRGNNHQGLLFFVFFSPTPFLKGKTLLKTPL